MAQKAIWELSVVKVVCYMGYGSLAILSSTVTISPMGTDVDLVILIR